MREKQASPRHECAPVHRSTRTRGDEAERGRCLSTLRATDLVSLGEPPVRPLWHLFSILLVLPSVLLAAAFVILGREVAAQSLPGILLQLLADALFVFPWGLLAALVVLLLIAAGGFVAQTRRAAGLSVALLGIGSFVVVLATIVSHSRISLDDLPFFIPGIVAICIGLWLAAGGHTGRGTAPDAVVEAGSGR